MSRLGKSSFDIVAFNTKFGGLTKSRHAENHTIYRQGSVGDAVFHILDGGVKLTVVSAKGKERVVAIHVHTDAEEAEDARIDRGRTIAEEIGILSKKATKGVEVGFALRDNLALFVAREAACVKLRSELLREDARHDPTQDGRHRRDEL